MKKFFYYSLLFLGLLGAYILPSRIFNTTTVEAQQNQNQAKVSQAKSTLQASPKPRKTNQPVAPMIQASNIIKLDQSEKVVVKCKDGEVAVQEGDKQNVEINCEKTHPMTPKPEKQQAQSTKDDDQPLVDEDENPNEDAITSDTEDQQFESELESAPEESAVPETDDSVDAPLDEV